MENLERQYILLSKDTPLIEFNLLKTTEIVEYRQVNSYKLQITAIHKENKNLFPKRILLLKKINKEDLLNWIESRKIPKNRQFTENILNAIGDNENPLRYADITQALSVNDAYWIKRIDQKIMWKDCNLYEHPFDERLSMVAFTGHSRKIKGLITSPEITSNGALKKCWKRIGDSIYLMKGDDIFPKKDGRTQAILEYYACQIAQNMGIDYVPYELGEFKHSNNEKEIVCLSKLFTNENVGYVTADIFFASKGVDVEKIDYTSSKNQLKLANLFGKNKYADMMIFDGIICNQDRHFGNFGYLINNNTGDFIKPAPIFDNGMSLLYRGAAVDLANPLPYIKGSGGEGVMGRFDDRIWDFIEKRHLPFLRKLTTFKFQNHPKYPISEKTIALLSKFINRRAQRAMILYREKEKAKKLFLNQNMER